MATGDRAILLHKLGARAKLLQAQVAVIGKEHQILMAEVEALVSQLDGYMPTPESAGARLEKDG